MHGSRVFSSVALALVATGDLPSGAWHSLRVPVAAESVAAAADVTLPPLPEDLLVSVIRTLHERPVETRGGPLATVIDRLRSGDTGGGQTLVPLPLAPSTWADAVFRAPIEPSRLTEALLSDRRASLLYVGLLEMDAQTLAWLEENPAVLSLWHRHHSSVVAAFGRSLVVRSGRVVTPGGERSREAWESIVGAPASDASAFLSALLARDRGRLAFFFDALTQADEPHRRFVLGPSGERTAAANLASVYVVFQRVSPEWDAEVHPFYRLPVNPARVLRSVKVDDRGRVLPAAMPALWALVFGGPPPAGDRVDPAWLLEALTLGSRRQSSARAEQLAFGQRTFAGSAAGDVSAVGEAISAFSAWPALLVALEHLGVTEPAAFVSAARRAEQLSGGVDRDRAVELALLQGALATVGRATRAGTVDERTAQGLAASLLAIDPTTRDYSHRVVGWIDGALLPALRRATGVDPAAPAETVLLRSLAGVSRSRAEAPTVIWEGASYRADVPAGELARLQTLREFQGPPTLDDALALHRAVDPTGGDRPGQSVSSLARQVSDLLSAVPDGDETRALRQALTRASRRLAREYARAAGAKPSEALKRELSSLSTLVTADVVAAFAYLPWLGDPDGPARLGGHVARRHRFEVRDDLRADRASPPWSLPRETVTPESGWHVEGALLGLDTALARLALRRLDSDRVPSPALDEESRRQLAVEAAQAWPMAVSPSESAAVVRALEAGRRWAASLRGRPDALSEADGRLQLDARREQAVRWALAEDLPGIERRFALVELAEMGGLDAASPVGFREAAARGRCLTDLSLRILEGLATRGLPPTLLPSMLSMATQDLIDSATPSDDAIERAVWQFAHTLPPERIEDYLSALAGNGPLVASGGPEPGRERP